MSPGSTTPSCAAALATTLALIDQFTASLVPTDPRHHGSAPSSPEAPSPLLLLAAAAKSLKAQVTKLSLLTVTAPFTPSAVATTLQAVNDSVLPTLVTAALLVSADGFTASFATECRAYVTEATGRVWQDCDVVVAFAEGGIPMFVVSKAKQWLELMKDAVAELQQWDPEEEVDEADLFGDAEANASDRATISAGVKDQALKVLSRIPQSVHVVVKQRLEKVRQQQLSSHVRARLDPTLARLSSISDLIDESAEGMYMGNLELCLKKAGEARAVTIELVEHALHGFIDDDQRGQEKESQEDKYVKRALDWIRQVETNPTWKSTPDQETYARPGNIRQTNVRQTWKSQQCRFNGRVTPSRSIPLGGVSKASGGLLYRDY
ncbi:hypothetical protein DV737_g3555, partial [Chaetothyriales sp. CBS 132003]